MKKVYHILIFRWLYACIFCLRPQNIILYDLVLQIRCIIVLTIQTLKIRELIMRSQGTNIVKFV